MTTPAWWRYRNDPETLVSIMWGHRRIGMRLHPAHRVFFDGEIAEIQAWLDSPAVLAYRETNTTAERGSA